MRGYVFKSHILFKRLLLLYKFYYSIFLWLNFHKNDLNLRKIESR